METDLHAPLGQKRPEPRKRSGLFSLARVGGVLTLLGVIGLSVYAARMPDTLRGNDPAAEETETAAAQPSGNAQPAPPGIGLERQAPQSGADVRQTTTADGAVVTTYAPRTRDNEGPALIGAGSRTQDSRLAGFPNAELEEDSAFGKLPVIGPDGLTPSEFYARPWSGTRGTRVAIVIAGLGLSQTGTQKAIRTLPPDVTLAFAASGNSLSRWVQESRRQGHEVLLQVPLEPFDYPANNPGPDTLLVSREKSANLDSLHKAMARMNNYTGIMNYMGARFLADAEALEPVMRDIGERGLLFLDDGSSARSQTGALARTLGVRHSFGDLQIDGMVSTDAILKKLDELERIARRNGTAVGIGFAFDETIEAVAQWSEEAQGRGIEIVGVASLTSP
ncbi:divergent polysaccharide deacetylase family protein [Rhizobiaceae bacterium BDR2-2]|uniref:Divergent polysaccharide deacetylase family protein n=1 Tax=Ectorhizobium quercum TaxID=2965071 RepID=A0AAE3SYH2_9HYPH|nr:divergent polysaccharide deacetylase family protein [Ectorhizobium quercum]MCX8999535.1 divergent polysaccharide deacetylase family protein [Ectorhizobium quercum]